MKFAENNSIIINENLYINFLGEENRVNRKRILSGIIALAMGLGICSPGVNAYAQGTGEFSNALPVVQKTHKTEKFVGKPLIILMDFPDYKHTDLDTKESFRINSFKGSETTPSFYEKIFFGDETYETSNGDKHMTVNKYFKEESGGTYEFKGKVVGWYTADKNAAYYGGNANGVDGNDQVTSRELVTEAVEKASKDVDLSEFDVEDKWDLDCDGNYNEPDGIIDSVVVIHAGMGEEWGGGSLGGNSIWPFRWGYGMFGHNVDNLSSEYKNSLIEYNPKSTDKTGKSYYVEDFTVFEQDLPIDLFNHEFGHVLGLPDLYSYDGANPPVDNWSIMGGSYTGNPIGSEPVSYGAYCKEFLQNDFLKRGRTSNWQNSKTVNLNNIDQKGFDIVLDQASIKGTNKDTVRIDLPPMQGEPVAVPPEGTKCFFSGTGDEIENYMISKQSIDLSSTNSPKLSFKTWYDIDEGYDFASVQVRETGSKDWVTIKDDTGLTTDKVDPWVESSDPASIKYRNPGWGFTGKSSTWKDVSFDLSKFAGKKIDLRFRFRTDDNTPAKGIYFDDVKIMSGTDKIFADNAENETMFNFDGFKIDDGKREYNHYYLLEWRGSGANTDVDKGLDTISIYSKGLSYETGLVVWYINEKYTGSVLDQDCDTHPGEVAVGVVDSDQNPIMYKYSDGSSKIAKDREEYQLRDAAFSLRPDRDWTLDKSSYKVQDTHTFMRPVFNDNNDYRSNFEGKDTGLILQKYGLKVFVTEESKNRSTVKIHIAKDEGKGVLTTQTSKEIKEIKAEGGKLYITPDQEYGKKAYTEFTNIGGKNKEYVLNYENGKYVCTAPDIDEKNINNISYVIFEDKLGNAKAIYNKDVNKIYGADFKNLGQDIEKPVENKVPVAHIDALGVAKVNEDIQFKGEASSDEDGQIVSYAWNFGDGKTSSEKNPKHSYDKEGTYIVTLEVVDDKGAKAQVSMTTTIIKNETVDESKVLPIANINAMAFEKTNNSIVFSGENSVCLNGKIVSYEWDFGDGTTAEGKKFAHTFKKAGTYNVKLKVKDDKARVGEVQFKVTIADVDKGLDVPNNLTMDQVYVKAYDATELARKSGSQDMINYARTYIRRLVQLTNHDRNLQNFLVGTLSSNLDPIQHKIFVNFYSVIYNADKVTLKASLTQVEINEAREYILGFLGAAENAIYVPSWSLALDKFQQNNMSVALESVNKAESSKTPVDIAMAINKVEELSSVTNNETVLNFAFSLQDRLDKLN